MKYIMIIIIYLVCLGFVHPVDPYHIDIGVELFSRPIISGDKIFIGTTDGRFMCVNKASKQVLWSNNGYIRIDSNPIESDGKIYFCSINEKINCISKTDGSLIWSRKNPGCGYTSPLMDGNNIICLGKNKGVIYEKNNGAELNSLPYIGVGISALINKRNIFINICGNLENDNYKGQGELLCIDLDKRIIKWKSDIDGACMGSPRILDDLILIGSRGGSFRALNINDGALTWKIACRDHFDRKYVNTLWCDGYPITVKDTAFFYAHNQNILDPSMMYCVSKSGNILWKSMHDSSISGTIVESNGQIVAVSQNREIIKYEIGSGIKEIDESIKKLYDRGEFSNITVDGDDLWINGADGNLWFIKR